MKKLYCDILQENFPLTEGVTFSHLYAKLPNLLSQAMAKEVSIPIAFVSLLHLANEKVITNSLILCYYSVFISYIESFDHKFYR